MWSSIHNIALNKYYIDLLGLCFAVNNDNGTLDNGCDDDP